MTASTTLPTLIIDTREQQPYTFDVSLCQSMRRKLDAGDYSIEGLEDRVAVERKSLDDFAGTLSNSTRRKRFFAELQRMENYSHRCVVVEGGLQDILVGNYRSDANPKSLFGSALSLMVDAGIQVAFCGDRPHACHFTQMYLLQCHRTLSGTKPKIDKNTMKALRHLVALLHLDPDEHDYDRVTQRHILLDPSNEISSNWGRILRLGIKNEWIDIETHDDAWSRSIQLGCNAPPLEDLPKTMLTQVRRLLKNERTPR